MKKLISHISVFYKENVTKSNVFFLSAVCFCSYGLSLIYKPAAFIFIGISFGFLAYVQALGEFKQSSVEKQEVE